MTRWAGVGWALAALALAEFGARQWPLAAAGMVPLALVLCAAAATRAPGLAWGGPVPLAAARASMLPMMATLPAMATWCSSNGVTPATMLLLHAAAMLLPALWMRGASLTACRALLLAGGAALALPGVQGLMLASTLHAAAAGIACAGEARGTRGQRTAPLVLAAAVLVVGLALASAGPAALQAMHLLIASFALWPSSAGAPRLGGHGRAG